MATTNRKVNLALIAYRNDEGQSLYAQRGDEIQVGSKDLERFDALNEQHGDSGVLNEGPHPEPFLDPTTPAGPEPLDHGGLMPEPQPRDPLATWQAYAEQEGVDPEGKTKKELISELTGE